MSSTSHAPQIAIVAMTGELDTDSLQRRATLSLDAGLEQIVIDLGEVTGISTRTISSLCCALRGVSRRGARLTIVGASPRLRDVIELCELDNVTLHASVDAAIAPGSHLFAW